MNDQCHAAVNYLIDLLSVLEHVTWRPVANSKLKGEMGETIWLSIKLETLELSHEQKSTWPFLLGGKPSLQGVLPAPLPYYCRF